MSSDTTAQRVNNQRRLLILSLLHTRPHTEAELYAALVECGALAPETPNQRTMSSAQHAQFRRDLAAIRAIGCEINCDHRTRIYTWRNSPFSLSLEPAHLSALTIVLDTFAEASIPHADDIRALFAHLLALLPAEQRKSVTSRRRAFTINLHELSSYSETDQQTAAQIEKAIAKGVRLNFTYHSPRDGKLRQHEVEPLKLEYRGGHVYLYGWHIRRNKELPYRLDNIIPGSAQAGNILAQHQRIGPQPVTIRYRLSVAIARNSVSQHFANQQVERHPDGSATVTAQTDDLFEARRILLSYGDGCVALEPPEWVAEFCQIAVNLYQTYCNPQK
ncbi:MAG: hypothetical protein DLM69_06120 [Candidatus Chloroheliales bacterium]|nr:MAG: hypothetical protein DLM69_06120 [Chloroflexota bacterium]